MSIRQRRNRRYCGPHRYERGRLERGGAGAGGPAGAVAVGPAHADALAAIHAAAFRGQEAWSASVFAGQLALPGSFALLDPAGGMVLARVIAEEAEILTLAVVPQARRGGVARRLLAGAMQRAAAAGARRCSSKSRRATCRRAQCTTGRASSESADAHAITRAAAMRWCCVLSLFAATKQTGG